MSGGDDGILRFWKADDMSPLHKVALPESAEAVTQSIRTISADSRQRVLVGTKANEIYERMA